MLLPTDPVAPSTLIRLGAGIEPGCDVAAGSIATRFARAADTALSNRYDPSKIARAGECTLMTKPAARSKRRL